MRRTLQVGMKIWLTFTLDLVSSHSAIQVTYVSSGIITIFVLVFVCLHFTLSDTGVLNSLEELYITCVSAVNSFARVLNPREGSIKRPHAMLSLLKFHIEAIIK